VAWPGVLKLNAYAILDIRFSARLAHLAPERFTVERSDNDAAD